MDTSVTGLLVLLGITMVPFLPSDVTIIGMAVAAAQGDGPSLALVIAAGTVGGLVSDQLLYLAGRTGGRVLVARLSRRRRFAAAIGWVDTRLRRRPRRVLVIARWVPSGGLVGALLAGSLRRPVTEFFTASAIGLTLWTTYEALLGYAGGQIFSEPEISMALSLTVALVLIPLAFRGVRVAKAAPAEPDLEPVG
ncbi:hypothetical protein GCM10009754_63220 [Amycolatopsis minnesotensis]|uniref:VTT domain-containing protein n=1 Tax=Amycolatopsis minnesotensis TaxID=337894 RepID=A0ABP5DFY9_9PSEU